MVKSNYKTETLTLSANEKRKEYQKTVFILSIFYITNIIENSFTAVGVTKEIRSRKSNKYEEEYFTSRCISHQASVPCNEKEFCGL